MQLINLTPHDVVVHRAHPHDALVTPACPTTPRVSDIPNHPVAF